MGAGYQIGGQSWLGQMRLMLKETPMTMSSLMCLMCIGLCIIPVVGFLSLVLVSFFVTLFSFVCFEGKKTVDLIHFVQVWFVGNRLLSSNFDCILIGWMIFFCSIMRVKRLNEFLIKIDWVIKVGVDILTESQQFNLIDDIKSIEWWNLSINESTLRGDLTLGIQRSDNSDE